MPSQVDALFYAKVDYKTLQRQNRIIDTKSYVSTLMIKVLSTSHFKLRLRTKFDDWINHKRYDNLKFKTNYNHWQYELVTSNFFGRTVFWMGSKRLYKQVKFIDRPSGSCIFFAHFINSLNLSKNLNCYLLQQTESCCLIFFQN